MQKIPFRNQFNTGPSNGSYLSITAMGERVCEKNWDSNELSKQTCFGEFTDFSANKGNILGEAMRKTNDQKSIFFVSTEGQTSSLTL